MSLQDHPGGFREIDGGSAGPWKRADVTRPSLFDRHHLVVSARAPYAAAAAWLR